LRETEAMQPAAAASQAQLLAAAAASSSDAQPRAHSPVERFPQEPIRRLMRASRSPPPHSPSFPTRAFMHPLSHARACSHSDVPMVMVKCARMLSLAHASSHLLSGREHETYVHRLQPVRPCPPPPPTPPTILQQPPTLPHNRLQLCSGSFIPRLTCMRRPASC